jgi:hypothetical protein
MNIQCIRPYFSHPLPLLSSSPLPMPHPVLSIGIAEDTFVAFNGMLDVLLDASGKATLCLIPHHIISYHSTYTACIPPLSYAYSILSYPPHSFSPLLPFSLLTIPSSFAPPLLYYHSIPQGGGEMRESSVPLSLVSEPKRPMPAQAELTIGECSVVWCSVV